MLFASFPLTFEHGPPYRFTLNASVTAAMDGKVVMWNLRMGSGGKYKAPKKVRTSTWGLTDTEASLRAGWSIQGYVSTYVVSETLRKVLTMKLKAEDVAPFPSFHKESNTGGRSRLSIYGKNNRVSTSVLSAYALPDALNPAACTLDPTFSRTVVVHLDWALPRSSVACILERARPHLVGRVRFRRQLLGP